MPRFKVLTLVLFVIAGCSHVEAAAPPPPRKRNVQAAKQVSPSAVAIPILQRGIEAHKQGQYSLAEEYFKQAITKMGPADPNLLVAYDNLAKLYYKEDHYQQALPWAQKALPFLARRYGATSLNEADGLYLVANIFFFLKDNTQAEMAYKRAIALYEHPSNAGKYSADYPSALQNLGVIASQKNDRETAMAFYKKALIIKQQHQEPDVGILLENLGSNYQNLNKLREAVEYYQQALASYEKNLGSDSAEAKRVYFKLANIQSAATSHATAQAPGATVEASANRYNGQFFEAGKKAYNQDHNYEEAARQFSLALQQAQKFYPGEAQFIATLQAALGKSLYLSETNEGADSYLEQALSYQSKHLSTDNLELLNTHTFLGLVYTR